MRQKQVMGDYGDNCGNVSVGTMNVVQHLSPLTFTLRCQTSVSFVNEIG